MTQDNAVSTRSASSSEILDIWSRTSRRHRIHAILMLVLLAVLFAGLCCFTFWLRTGYYLPWRCDHYSDLLLRSFSPTNADQITLSDFLSSPIPVQDVPVHAVIMGLQFASLSSLPILVAILYRLPISVVFAAMVFFLAAMPWLGITVMIGCIVASTGIFRFSFRYASALIGLIPVGVYFIMASWEPADAPPKMFYQQALFYAPWVLALLGSCVICAVALAITRLINYRPGGIPPLLGMLFAIPVLLFHSQVGRDELAYRLLVQEIGPGSRSIFASVDVGLLAKRVARQVWTENDSGSYDEIYRRMLETTEQAVIHRTERERYEAISHCDAFIEDFPKSRYVPSVLFLKGRAENCRMDAGKLLRDRRAEFRSDLPNATSRQTWQTIVEQFPTNAVSASALHNLAILEARKGDIDAAIAMLDKLISDFDVQTTSTRPATGRPSFFQRVPVAARLGIDVNVITLQAKRLREMLLACRHDAPAPMSSIFGERHDGSDVLVKPVQMLMQLDYASPCYRTNLEGIARAFPDSQTAAYVEVRLALMEPAISRRIQRFRDAVAKLDDKPAGAEARFYLAQALQEDSLIEEAKTALEELVKSHPDSCWAQDAKENLTTLSILLEVTP